MKKIAVTGACGQIAYQLLFRIANGDFLGPKEEIALHLLDVPGTENALLGVKMELNDSVFPLLKEIKIGTSAEEMFEDISYAFLVGSKPRGKGMERKDLLQENGAIFVEQGKALNKSAKKDVRVLVVGNPCNTNCLIAMHHAKDLPKEQFFAMTRLDQNRAVFQLANRAKVGVEEVDPIIIWGNHSSTQVPDFVNAKIQGKSVTDCIDRKWLEKEFVQIIQKRGAQVIEARGKSSAASAANAAIGAFRDVVFFAKEKKPFSSAIFSANNPYGIAEDLVFSFPCKTTEKRRVEIVQGFHLDSFLQEKIEITQKELIEERDMIKGLL